MASDLVGRKLVPSGARLCPGVGGARRRTCSPGVAQGSGSSPLGPSHFLAGESGLVHAVPGQGPRTAWNRARQLEAPAWDCRAGISRHLPPSPVCGGLGGVTVSHEQSWRPPLPPPTHANSRLPGRSIQEEPFRGHVTGGFLVVRILREWRREPKIHSRL